MATAPVELHRVAAERLARQGQRYTTGRRTLVEVLASTDRPLTIGEILAGARGLAQSSAYRNLTVLERAGVVHRVIGTDDFARFELDEELTGHHHHLICSRCGRVDDVCLGTALERALDQAVARVATGSGFSVESHRLDLLGTCPACR